MELVFKQKIAIKSNFKEVKGQLNNQMTTWKHYIFSVLFKLKFKKNIEKLHTFCTLWRLQYAIFYDLGEALRCNRTCMTLLIGSKESTIVHVKLQI